MPKVSKAPDPVPADTCPCEAWIPASIMDGYACGNPLCCRTAPAKASFDAFVAELVRKRGDSGATGEKSGFER